MIVVTTPYLAGHRIVESKGMVFGLVVRSRGLGGNLMAGLRSLGGGEIHEYTSLLEDTRRQALDRLVRNATMGANAVISMRFDSSELSGTMSEIVAYGTAVIVEPDANRHGADARSTRWVPISPVSWSSASALRDCPRPVAGRHAAAPGLYALFIGLALIVAAVIERVRYRSNEAEATGEPLRDPAAANRPARASIRGSGRPRSASRTRRPASRCASGSIRWPANGGTSPRTDRFPPHPGRSSDACYSRRPAPARRSHPLSRWPPSTRTARSGPRSRHAPDASRSVSPHRSRT